MGFGAWIKGIFGGGEKDDDGSCLVCGATELAVLAADAYRCGACGYEGGDGYATWKEAGLKEALRRRDPRDLRAAAAKTLADARLTLLAATGSGGEGVGWSIAIESGGALTAPGGAFASANREEAARIREERKQGVARARAEVLSTLPTLEVLVEKGDGDAAAHASRVGALAATETADEETLAALISEVGAGLAPREGTR